jgi:hypothetical protein
VTFDKIRPTTGNMKYNQTKGNEIEGQLDIFVTHNENEYRGKILKWDEVSIHGNPEGLKSLAKLLIEIAELNQEKVEDKYLPIGAREHYHLRAGIELSNSSDQVIVGRLDAKGTGVFYDRFIPKKISRKR